MRAEDCRPLWRLKVNCLRYCSHVHAHHGAEDVLRRQRWRGRRRVIDGLRDLHVHLLEHLDYEERHVGPTMRRLEQLEGA